MSGNKVLKMTYIVIFLLALVIPGVWTFIGKQETIGNEEVVDFSDANYFNVADKAEEYMNQKFGFRNKLVEFNNKLSYNLFGESGNDQVIVGKDGWLFYASALHDYNGTDVLSDEEIAKIAKILSMTEAYVTDNGGKFVFVSAPNKMEIYGEYMPYYHVEDIADGNYEKLFSQLEKLGVSNVDLKEYLKTLSESSEQELYYKTDSHWNEYGAALAYEKIMQFCDEQHIEFSKEYVIKENAFKGDLYTMLFPDGKAVNEAVIINTTYEFYYTSNFRGPDDLVIQTANDDASGKLVMWRDSFGEFVYSFFAESFYEAEFRREIPYNFTNIGEKDVVVIELVERNLPLLLEKLPVIKASEVTVEAQKEKAVSPEIRVSKASGYNLLEASIPELPQECTEIYFKVYNGDESVVYEAYPSAENGDACIYIEELLEGAEISVIYEYNGTTYETLKNTVNCV